MSKFKIGDKIERASYTSPYWKEFTEKHKGPYIVTSAYRDSIFINSQPFEFDANYFKLAETIKPLVYRNMMEHIALDWIKDSLKTHDENSLRNILKTALEILEKEQDDDCESI